MTILVDIPDEGLVASMFFDYQIEVIHGDPDYMPGYLDVPEAQRVLRELGISADCYTFLEVYGGFGGHYAWCVIEFSNQEDIVILKMAFNEAGKDEQSVKYLLSLARRGITRLTYEVYI